MKKLTNYLLASAALVSMVFTSCSDDDTPKPPSLSFRGGSEYVSSDATVTVGENFIVGVTSLPNSESGKKLSNFTIVRTFNNVPFTVLDSALGNVESLDMDIIFSANLDAGSERFVFTVTDKDGEMVENAIVITTELGIVPITEKDNIELNAQADGPNSAASNESFLATVDGATYLVGETGNNADVIDMMFMRHNSLKATYPDFSLRSPDYAVIEDYFDLIDAATYASSGMRNTKLMIITSSVDFDNLDNSGIVEATDGVESGSAIVDDLDEGMFVGFITEDGKRGVIRVESTVPGATYQASNMTISYKVQQ